MCYIVMAGLLLLAPFAAGAQQAVIATRTSAVHFYSESVAGAEQLVAAVAYRGSGDQVRFQRFQASLRTRISNDGHDPVISVFGERLPLPECDSTLIVLVDRVDSVGGPPVVQSFVVRSAPVRRTTTVSATTKAQLSAYAEALPRRWLHILRAHPRSRAFLARSIDE